MRRDARRGIMKRIFEVIDSERNRILAAERAIWSTPELGYREWKSSEYMVRQFAELGYEVDTAGNIPGFYTVIDTGRPGPEVLVLAELDALICSSHPEALTGTGAVHVCGHNAQCAAMLGIAAALKDADIISKMCGRIRLCVVPAEECIEREYRRELRDKGIIKYLGGKSEFLSRGYFDGVDMAFMMHISSGDTTSGGEVRFDGGSLGFIAKTVTFKGVTAHASAAPWLGKNALYAATTALASINAMRETFRDEDKVRWHPILTSGGDVVNNIPDKVVIESQLRAATFEALDAENKKIDRAIVGAAIAFGVQVEIDDEPGYAPLRHDNKFSQVAREAYNEIAPAAGLERRECTLKYGIGGGSMDMGDLCAIMPVIHPYISGSTGRGHGDDYYIVDPETACVTNAKWQVMILKLLLENDGARAKEIINGYIPPFPSKDAFLAHQDGMRRYGERVEDHGDGSISVK